jgi:hypothetical protein
MLSLVLCLQIYMFFETDTMSADPLEVVEVRKRRSAGRSATSAAGGNTASSRIVLVDGAPEPVKRGGCC